jgi:hypothetical protein
MIDGQDILAKQSDLGNGLIPERKPSPTDPLIMPGKIRAFDPERWSFGRTTHNFHHCKFLLLDPDPSFKQVFVLPFGTGLNDKTLVAIYTIVPWPCFHSRDLSAIQRLSTSSVNHIVN